MHISNSITLTSLAILIAANCQLFGQQERPAVSLLLTKVSAERQQTLVGAERRPEEYISFRCEAVLDNASGNALTLHTRFASVFDGLELVVTTHDGTILAQQSYTLHQSPSLLFSSVASKLEKGRTEGSLSIPVSDLPSEQNVFKVRLVGELSGSDYQRILSSETLEVQVK